MTVRRIGNQWFNLNSLLTGPELVSNTYLSLFLAQLMQVNPFVTVVPIFQESFSRILRIFFRLFSC